jgi:hypothetical protein
VKGLGLLAPVYLRGVGWLIGVLWVQWGVRVLVHWVGGLVVLACLLAPVHLGCVCGVRVSVHQAVVVI